MNLENIKQLLEMAKENKKEATKAKLTEALKALGVTVKSGDTKPVLIQKLVDAVDKVDAEAEKVVLKANSVIAEDGSLEYKKDETTKAELDSRFYERCMHEAEISNSVMWDRIPLVREFVFKPTADDAYHVDMSFKSVGQSPVIELFQNSNHMFRSVRVNGVNFQIGDRYDYYDEIIVIRTPRNKEAMDELSKGFSLINDPELGWRAIPTYKAEEMYSEDVINSSKYFKAMTWGPSGEKAGSKFAFASKVKDVDEVNELFEKLDTPLGGTFTEQYSSIVDLDRVYKDVSRWGNYTCNMRILFKIDLSKDNVVLIDTELLAAQDAEAGITEQLKAAGVDFGMNIMDGTNWLNSDAAAEQLAEELINRYGYIHKHAMKLARRICRRWAVQNRITHINTKCMSENLNDSEMKMYARTIKAMYNRPGQKEVVRTIGNPKGRCCMIVDKDGAKMVKKEMDGKEILTVYCMAIAGASESTTSNQLLVKCLEKDNDKTFEIVEEMLLRQLRDTFRSSRNSKAIEGGNALDNIAAMYDESTTGTDFALLSQSFKEVGLVAKSIWRKFKIKMESMYNHVMFDNVFHMSGGLVDHVLTTRMCLGKEMVEVFSWDILEKYKSEISEIENSNMSMSEKTEALDKLLSAAIIKYPSAGANEYLPVRYLTKKEFFAKVDAAIASIDTESLDALLEAMGMLPDDEDLKDSVRKGFLEYLENRLKNLPFGCTIYAAFNWIKQKLAGMDSDYDGTVAVLDKLKFLLIEGAVNELTFIDYFDKNGLDYSPFYEMVEQKIATVEDNDEFDI